jgi:TolB-like protein/class 3 adenylate cyclase/Tfp pilus assembly protein PilF
MVRINLASGAALPEGRVHRRLAAILAADVAGYSRLMGLDEVGTARTLREHRKVTDALVAKHGGRIVKTTGDGVLLEFPSVVDAVECAVAVQSMMAQRNEGIPQDRRMLFRIGINLGDILIEGDDILGDGVNIAARLEGIAEPGGICISSSAYDQVHGKVPVEFTNLGEQTLKNIARPMRVYAVELNANIDRVVAPPSSAPRLSIVVLPFANIGGDPEQEYFVDGVTESLTTDLSRIAGAFVIARNTAFTFKGKAIDVKKLGRELNIRYVLEGSVQRSGNQLRVNVQLVDAQTANHLWAERFDKPVVNLFEMQDEIVSRLVNTLDAELIAVEALRAERSSHLDVMDLCFRGVACLHRGVTKEHLAQARSFFERALALDPQNVQALVGMARVDLAMGVDLFSDDRAASCSAAEAALIKAMSLAPRYAAAHMLLGAVYIFTARATQGIAECKEALSLDRNLADAHAWIGLGKYFLGHAEETEAHVCEALRLSPCDIFAYRWMMIVGVAKVQDNADTEAVAWLRRSIDANRNFPFAHFHLAAALALLGSLNEARAAAKVGLALNPAFTIRRFQRHAVASEHPTYLAKRRRFEEGMRMAGVPEG